MFLNYFRFTFLLILLVLFQVRGIGQEIDPANADSLFNLVENNKTHDTIKIDAYYHLARIFVYSNPDSAEYLVSKGMEISERIEDLNGMGEAYGWMGYLTAQKGDIAGALDYNLKSLDVAQKLELKAEYPVILNNLANLHVDLGNHDQSLKYFLECVAINKELGNEQSLATNYNNIGSYYRQKEDYDQALAYFKKSLSIRIRIGDEFGQSYTYSNMGAVYERTKMIDTALYYYEKGLKIRRKLNLNRAISTSLFKIANIYFVQGKYKEAQDYAFESNDIATKWEFTYEQKESAKILYKIFKAKGNLAQALDYFEQYATLHDSINSIENQRAILRGKYQFEYNQKHLLDSLEKDKILIANQLLDEENKVKEGRISVQRLWLTTAVLSIVILLIILFAIRKTAAVRMEKLRTEIRFRLSETIRLKEELETKNEIKHPVLEDVNIVLNDKLTEREQEILDALVLGLSNKEIGEKLFLSVNTIKTHILSLYTKLDVNNRTQAAIKGSLLKFQKNE